MSEVEATDPAAVHQAALVIDMHADTAQRFVDDHWDFTTSLDGGMLNLATARAGNLAAEFLAVWVEPTQWKGKYAHRTLALIDGIHEQVRRNRDSLRLCVSPAQIEDARRDCQFAVLIGIEGGHAIENDLSLLRVYHTLGASYMTLTWSNTNEWADSCGDIADSSIAHHNGLTAFGRDVVHEMNRLGMMVDISHASDKTFADVLEITRAPIIASHSCARALTNAPRNMTDDMLQAIRSNGGVVMANFFPAFIDERWRIEWNAQAEGRHQAQTTLEAEYKLKGRPIPHRISDQIDRAFAAQIARPPMSALIDHIDHIARVAGIDHVGIGSDFDGIPATPQGIESAADLPRITAALMSRGHSAEDMHKLLGGNLMRVFGEVQQITQP